MRTAFETTVDRRQLGDLRVGQLLGRERRGTTRHRPEQLVVFGDVARRDVGDERTAVAAEREQAFLAEHHDGLADRAPADVERLADRLLIDPLTRPQHAGQDEVPDVDRDLVGEGAAPHHTGRARVGADGLAHVVLVPR